MDKIELDIQELARDWTGVGRNLTQKELERLEELKEERDLMGPFLADLYELIEISAGIKGE